LFGTEGNFWENIWKGRKFPIEPDGPRNTKTEMAMMNAGKKVVNNLR